MIEFVTNLTKSNFILSLWFDQSYILQANLNQKNILKQTKENNDSHDLIKQQIVKQIK